MGRWGSFDSPRERTTGGNPIAWAISFWYLDQVLTAYTAPSPALFDAWWRAGEARLAGWLAYAQQRLTCDDAYGDLLLATEQYGALRGLALLIDDPTERWTRHLQLDAWMGRLLAQSHTLRVRCQTPLSGMR